MIELREKRLPHRSPLTSMDHVFPVLAIVGAIYAFLTYHVNMDDFFITLRYADNIASGKGWVFNPGEKVLGTTSPLLTILAAILIKTGVEGILAVRILSSLFLLGTSLFCYLYFRQKQQAMAGFAAGLLIFLVLPLKQLWGNEVPLCLFFLMGSLYFFDREKWTLSAVFQSLYALSRMEGLLFLVICSLILFWKKRKVVYPVLTSGVVILLPWFLFSVLYFGDLFPNTLYAKARQGARPDIWIPFSRGLFQTLSFIFMNISYPLLSVFSLLGIVTMIRKRHVLLLSWCVIHLTVYRFLGVPGSYSWYYYLLWLLYPMFIAGGIRALIMGIKTRGSPLPKWRRLLYAALTAFALYQGYTQPFTNTFYHNRYHLYLQVADHIEKTYSPDNKIISDEIGILGYFLEEYVILDTAGLIHGDIPSNSYFLYDYLVRTRNPELIVNCRYNPEKESREEIFKPIRIDIGSGRKMRYDVEKVFPGDNLLVRILKRE
ncbi:hypothetical protein JW926_02685 [Candidatus Sumerlaeota bacterium]|nr:hypothetical protein [Candidatus Sumerlaeota bacterium]